MQDIRQCDVTSINAQLHDVCFPDYFQGSSAQEVLAIPVHKGMTRDEFHEAAKDDFHAQTGWFDMAGAGTMGEDAIRGLVLCMEAGGEFEQSFPYCQPLEEMGDCDETCYAYVGLFAESDIED